MTNDARTSDDIERDIADDRAQIGDMLDNLQKKFSVDAIVNDVGNMFRGQVGDLGRTVSDTMGRNPTAVVLAGVGLAWLFLGHDRNRSARPTDRRMEPNSRSRHAGLTSTRWDQDLVPTDRSNEGPLSDDCGWYDDGQTSRERRLQGQGNRGRARVSSGNGDAADGIVETVRSAATAASETLSDSAKNLRHATSNLTERLSDGLEDFTEEARSRVLAARRAAHEARLSSEAAMNRASRGASHLFEDQPLVVGALAVALGAAIGGALPHSKIEDDALGASSDQLFADAQLAFREERDKAMAALKTASKGAKSEVKDMKSELEDLLPEGKSFGEVAVDRASGAARRVFERAKGEYDGQAPDRTKS